jgi:hypothetical protein
LALEDAKLRLSWASRRDIKQQVTRAFAADEANHSSHNPDPDGSDVPIGMGSPAWPKTSPPGRVTILKIVRGMQKTLRAIGDHIGGDDGMQK